MRSERHAFLPAVVACAAAMLGLATNAIAQTSPPPAAPAGSVQGEGKQPVPPSPATASTPPEAAARPQSPTTTFVSLTGLSQPEAAPTAALPVPEGTASHDHPTAFRADFKLPLAVASLLSSETGPSASPFAPVPQLVLGFQSGRVSFGAGLGFTRTALSSSGLISPSGGGSTQSLTELLIAPTLTLDAFQSADGKVAFYGLGAALFGILLESNESVESDVGFQFAIGASYALHDNFRIGMEAGPVGHFYSTGEGESLSTMSLYTALIVTFAYPR
jgi:hypothetical protein